MLKTQTLIATANPQLRGQAAVLTGILVGSFAAIFIRLAQQEHLPAVAIVTLRLSFASLLLTPYVLTNYRAQIARLTRRQVVLSAGAGLWLGIHFALLTTAFEHTSVLVTSVLGLSSPLWVALIEVTLLKARIPSQVWFGLAIAATGGVIIALAGNGSAELGGNPLLGGVLALSSAVASAIYLIVGRNLRRSNITLFPYIWLVFSAANIFVLLVTIVTQTPLIGYSFEGYLWAFMLALFPQLISHPLFNYALKYISATAMSVTGQLVVVISSFLAFAFFAEVPALLQIPGSLAIIAGVVLVNLGQARTS